MTVGYFYVNLLTLNLFLLFAIFYLNNQQLSTQRTQTHKKCGNLPIDLPRAPLRIVGIQSTEWNIPL